MKSFYCQAPPADPRRAVVSYKQTYVHMSTGYQLILSLPRKKSVVRSTDHLNMTISVDWNVKTKTKQTNYSLKYLKSACHVSGAFLNTAGNVS